MNRRTTLTRRTGLRVNPEQVKAWQDRSRRPLRPVSPRKRAWLAEYAEARVTVRARANGICEAQLPGCRGIGTECHHKRGRVGDDANQPEHLLWLCAECHRQITELRVPAYELGLMEKRNGASSSPVVGALSDTPSRRPGPSRSTKTKEPGTVATPSDPGSSTEGGQ